MFSLEDGESFKLSKERKGVFLQLIGSKENTSLQGPSAQILKTYEDVFYEPKGLPPTRSHDHSIPLKGVQHVPMRPYHYPFYQKEEIEKIVKELLDSGLIKHTHSPFSPPVLLVRKGDGTWRICMDYRSLNQVTIKDKFPIPVVDELLDELWDLRYVIIKLE